jgi:hypothetical protein
MAEAEEGVEVWDEATASWVPEKKEKPKFRLSLRTRAGVMEVGPFTLREAIIFHRAIAKAKEAMASTRIRSVV